jgi:ubiquitin fusion degradation protein 1
MVIDTPPIAKTGFAAFQGGGQSLRGKNKQTNSEQMDTAAEDGGEDDGPLNLPFGQLYFGFPVVPPPQTKDNDEKGTKPVFTGSGQTLRTKKK